MSNSVNIISGLNIPSQLPLDVKTRCINEATLKDLGLNNNLAYTYYKGLEILCIAENTKYIWDEVPTGKELTGLLLQDFIYPDGIINDEIIYSNKKYNFFKINNSNITNINSGDNITISGTGIVSDPLIINGLRPPFIQEGSSFKPRDRNNSQFGTIGNYSYDFSDADIGALDDQYGQIGQIGVHPTEQYGALGDSSYTFGYNISAQGFADNVFGTYNHSDIQSQFSTITGRNNYNNSYNTLLSGSYNIIPYTYLGHKTVFGNGNVVNGSSGLTSGVALLNKSFGTTIFGQANLDYTNTEQGFNNQTAPIFIIGNGNITTPIGQWTATSRSDALKLLKNGLLTLPSVTKTLIQNDTSGKAVVTKEYLEDSIGSIPDGSETKLIPGINITISGTGTIASPYVINNTLSAPNGSETKLSSGSNISISGAGTTVSPYVINSVNTTYSAGVGLLLLGTTFNIDNLQKVITYPTDFTGTNYTLTSADNNYEIIINNDITNVTITVPTGLISKIGIGFTQKGTGDVSYIASGTTINTPIGLKIKGRYYQTYLSQELNTNIFYLGGNTKL